MVSHSHRRFIYLLICSFLTYSLANGKDYTVFSGGKSDYVIVVSTLASESEKYASTELQSCIERISGVRIPVVDCGNGKRGKRIILGYNTDSKQLIRGERMRDADDESFYYKNVEGDIVIVGGRDRGTMYGVFSFLENELNCRWYTETFTVTPQRKSYSFSKLNHQEAPVFSRRSFIYSEIGDPLFRVHSRLNERLITKPYTPINQIGGSYYFLSPHTLSFILPVEVYYDSHPEYYALVNGKRVKDQTQPCFTNPNVIRICKDEVRKIMQEYPEYDIIEISSLDNNNRCDCNSCKREIESLGSYTDLVLGFVNKVADFIKNEFPNKKVEFLAYGTTSTPPITIRPSKNVIVRICNHQACHIHGFAHCNDEKAIQFKQSLLGWKNLSSNLCCWEYAVDFTWYNIPFPNFYALRDNLIQYKEIGLTGAFIQGNNYSYNGELQALRIYVLAKLLWNPYYDVDTLVNDFINGYYGSSAKYIRQYYDLIHSYIHDDTHLSIFSNYTENYYTEKMIAESRALFNKAKSVADNEEIRRRVELEEFSVCLLKTLMNPQKAREDGALEQTKQILQRENVKVGGANSEKEYQRKISTQKTASLPSLKSLIERLFKFPTSL